MENNLKFARLIETETPTSKPKVKLRGGNYYLFEAKSGSEKNGKNINFLCYFLF
jgi:hypothetical protein